MAAAADFNAPGEGNPVPPPAFLSLGAAQRSRTDRASLVRLRPGRTFGRRTPAHDAGTVDVLTVEREAADRRGRALLDERFARIRSAPAGGCEPDSLTQELLHVGEGGRMEAPRRA